MSAAAAGISEQLAALEARVAALEQAGGNEQLQPGVFFINALGELEQQLSGKLEAAGIIFQESPTEPAGPESEIDWIDTAGTTRESLGAFADSKGHHHLTLEAIEGQATGLEARTGSANPNPALARARVLAFAPGASATIIDAAGASSFLQLLAPGVGKPLNARRVNFGQAGLVFTASKNSSTTAIAHGLGVEPLAIFALSLNAPAFGEIPICNASGLSEATFNLNAEITGAAITGTLPVFWIAIG